MSWGNQIIHISTGRLNTVNDNLIGGVSGGAAGFVVTGPDRFEQSPTDEFWESENQAQPHDHRDHRVQG